MRIIIDGVQEGEDRADPSLSQVLDSGSGISTTQSIVDLSSGSAIVAYSTDDTLWHFYGIAACAEQAETAMYANEAGYACSAGEAGCACYAENSTYSESSMTTCGITYQLGDEMCTWYPGCFYAWAYSGEGNWTMLPGYATGMYYTYDGGSTYNVAEFDSSGYFTACVYTACMANEAYCASFAQNIRCIYWDDYGIEQCADLYITFDPCTSCWSAPDLYVMHSDSTSSIRAYSDDTPEMFSDVSFSYSACYGYIYPNSYSMLVEYSASVRAPYNDDSGMFCDVSFSYDACYGYVYSNYTMLVEYSASVRAPYNDDSGMFCDVSFSYDACSDYVYSNYTMLVNYACAIMSCDGTSTHFYTDPCGGTPAYFDNTAWQTITVDGQDYTVLVSTMCAS